MGVIKGQTNNSSTVTESVTVSKTGNKTLLDVGVSGASASTGTGTGLTLAGSDALAGGSILQGLAWKAFTKDTSPDTVTDVYLYYSDLAKTNLISTITIIYDTADKVCAISATRADV